MTKRSNNAWLKRFMKERGLTRPQIATACAVNLSAVDRWLAPPRKVSHRKMPDMAVRLLTCMDNAEQLQGTVKKD
jgi:plasmid maintenance system antidote protein VapI